MISRDTFLLSSLSDRDHCKKDLSPPPFLGCLGDGKKPSYLGPLVPASLYLLFFRRNPDSLGQGLSSMPPEAKSLPGDFTTGRVLWDSGEEGYSKNWKYRDNTITTKKLC